MHPTSMTWGIWLYLMPDSANSIISSKDFSKFGMRGQTSPTCTGRPRAEKWRKMHLKTKDKYRHEWQICDINIYRTNIIYTCISRTQWNISLTEDSCANDLFDAD